MAEVTGETKYVCVPLEPTLEMLVEGRAASFNGMHAGYRAMLAARPTAPVVPVERAEFEKFLRWIHERAAFDEERAKPFPVIHDHACAQCNGTIVREGFVCTVHKARAFLHPSKEETR